MTYRSFAAGLAMMVLATASGAQEAAPKPAPAPDIAKMMEANAKIPDTIGSGPYPAIKTQDPAFPNHTVYRPRDLSALGGRKLPVYLWGNGGCSDDAASARLFLEEIASHGYLVVAAGTLKSGPGVAFKPEPPTPAPAGKPVLQVKTTAEDVHAGLDQALAANADPNNPLYGKVDASRVAVSGHSCGGLQALQIAGDPRIKAVIIHNSGVFADGSNPISGITVSKQILTTLHTPVLYVLGGPTDIAYPNGTDDFRKIETVPAALVNLPTGHGGTFMQPQGGEGAKVAVAWLDWQLRGDRTAARMFTGADCGLCRMQGVTIERKRIE